MPSFAISKFIILLEPLWVSAEFLLLSTGPLLYLIQTENAGRAFTLTLLTLVHLFWDEKSNRSIDITCQYSGCFELNCKICYPTMG